MNSCYRALFPLLVIALGVTLLAATGCSEREELAAPPRSAVEDVLLSVLGPDRGPVETLPLAVMVTPEDEPSFFRRANAEERAALYLPEGVRGVEIETMRSKYYPSWRVLFYETQEGQRTAPLTTAVVPIDGELMVVLQWRRAVRLADGSLRPDIRLHPGRGTNAADERMTVALLPAWDSR